LGAPTSIIESIDIVLVVYYRPWPFGFLQRRRLFGFEGKNNGKTINWYKEPAESMGTEFEEATKRWAKKLP
jgi:hypothetical protein